MSCLFWFLFSLIASTTTAAIVTEAAAASEPSQDNALPEVAALNPVVDSPQSAPESLPDKRPTTCQDFTAALPGYVCATSADKIRRADSRWFPQFTMPLRSPSKSELVDLVSQMSYFDDPVERDSLWKSLSLQKEADSPGVEPLLELVKTDSQLVVIKREEMPESEVSGLLKKGKETVDPQVAAKEFLVPVVQELQKTHSKNLVLKSWGYQTGSGGEGDRTLQLSMWLCAQSLGETVTKCPADPQMLDLVVLEALPETKADKAMDYYALGVSAYRVLLGQETPFEGSTHEQIVASKRSGQLKFNKGDDALLAFFVVFCLQIDRASRADEASIKRILDLMEQPRGPVPLEEPLTVNVGEDPTELPQFEALTKEVFPAVDEDAEEHETLSEGLEKAGHVIGSISVWVVVWITCLVLAGFLIAYCFWWRRPDEEAVENGLIPEFKPEDLGRVEAQEDPPQNVTLPN